MWLQPLKDIAVVSGKTARFECIAQAEPIGEVTWSCNGQGLENSDCYQMQYRNGVCRLTIPRAYHCKWSLSTRLSISKSISGVRICELQQMFKEAFTWHWKQNFKMFLNRNLTETLFLNMSKAEIDTGTDIWWRNFFSVNKGFWFLKFKKFKKILSKKKCIKNLKFCTRL